MLYSAVFIPLERLFARRVDQPVFRRQWVVDLTYFFINSLLIQFSTAKYPTELRSAPYRPH